MSVSIQFRFPIQSNEAKEMRDLSLSATPEMCPSFVAMIESQFEAFFLIPYINAG